MAILILLVASIYCVAVAGFGGLLTALVVWYILHKLKVV